MLLIDCFNHNIYLNNKLIGFIGTNELFISGNKFADITDDGIIIMNNKQIGYVSEDNAIIVKGKEVGYVDGENNFVFTQALM